MFDGNVGVADGRLEIRVLYPYSGLLFYDTVHWITFAICFNLSSPLIYSVVLLVNIML